MTTEKYQRALHGPRRRLPKGDKKIYNTYLPIFHPQSAKLIFSSYKKIQAEKFNLHKLLVMREQCK